MDRDTVCLVCGVPISRSSTERALWLDEFGMATSSRPGLHPHNPHHAVVVERREGDGSSRLVPPSAG